MSDAGQEFRQARDFVLRNRTDYAAVRQGFRWPQPENFNWALDWFDTIASRNDRLALCVVNADGDEQKLTFSELSRRSNQVAVWFRALGMRRGDRVMVMLGNQLEL